MDFLELIQDIWNEPHSQQAFTDRASVNNIQVCTPNRLTLTSQILSSAPYFFTNAERFAAESFRPSDQDVTMAKLRTTGIVETTFTMSSINFTLVDVGGQVSWLLGFKTNPTSVARDVSGSIASTVLPL